MKTYISILRGINLGGHNTIKMDNLRRLLSQNGLNNVETYIQSGNDVYQYKNIETKKLDTLIKENIFQEFGFEVPVITLTIEELKTVAKNNPFPNNKMKDPSFFHVTFLADKPQLEYLEKIKDINYQPDEFVILDKAVYLYCPEGYGNTKLSNKFLENKLKVTATTRNWKTTNELIVIADKINDKR
ncbi:MAG: DUF1697 domain-containing protein [Bacteroidales bacterium]|nr:DUF1697 domain-containing protein [Bacteroidales bacterium]